MAACDAVVRACGRPLLAPADGYYTLRTLYPDARFVASTTEAYLDALGEGELVWVETPSNPLLGVVDIAAVCEAAHAAGLARRRRQLRGDAAWVRRHWRSAPTSP